MGNWQGLQNVREDQYTCAHCGSLTASSTGWFFLPEGQNLQQHQQNPQFVVRLCSFCKQPTYIRPDARFPSPPFGQPVQHLPADIEALYEQARDCTAANAHTPAVLACRKILMHIGVDLKAAEGLSFLQYVEYLAAQGYVPPNGKAWVDHIRKKGNEANHEIVLMKKEDSQELISFVEMLLKFIYEFPNRVPKSTAAVPPQAGTATP
jgi:hypothetical protein